MALTLSPSSSSSSAPLFKYDVFLSFRGEDTRYNFTSHLHKELRAKKIETFIDYKLNRGYAISQSLLEAIEKSQISVVIFSRDYASSKWCLEELVKILECREKNNQIVIPVFYGVDPSSVRHQTGSFAEAFADHEHRFKESLDKVQTWKDALKKAADLSGWHSSTNKLESVLVEDIVNDVVKKLNVLSSNDTTGFVGLDSKVTEVGLDSKVKEIESLLCIGTDGVRRVGIWGSGGIGKTTLAEAVISKISHQFEGSYFIDNIRELLEQRGRLNHLGRKLVSTILGDKNGNIGTFVRGHNFTRNRLGRKNILICFDDVNDFRQIEILIESLCNSLGSRSRVIITARDRQMLKNCGVEEDDIYEVQKLLHFHALELFCCNAFKQNHPPADFVELSRRVVTHAGGIPLALKVLGSFLLGRPKNVWESAIIRLEKVLDKDILRVLKISYDELSDEEQMIFLDIACFLKGRDIDFVKQFLDVSGFCTEIGISVLIDKSLITISNNTITMHDLLQALGREIVRQEGIHDPNKRTRVWQQEDVYRVLNENKAAESVVGISFDMTKIGNVHLKFDVLAKMDKLRFLEFHRSSYALTVFRGHESVFIKLRHLQWHAYPSKSFRFYFQPTNLEVLILPSSLKGIPDVSGLNSLRKLEFYQCSNLKMLPEMPKLNELPNDIGALESLEVPYPEGDPIRDCPSSIIYLKNLKYLYLGYNGITELPEFPDGCLSSLRDLDLSGTSLESIPASIINLSNLYCLYIRNCKRLKCLPEFPDGCLSSLMVLDLSGTSLESIPASIINLSNLDHLYIRDCKRLKCLPKFPNGCLSSLMVLDLSGTSLESIPASIINLSNLDHLYIRDCKRLKCLPKFSNGCLSSLMVLDLSGTSLESIPASIINLSNLDHLYIRDCKRLKLLPKLQLGVIVLDGCTSLEVLSGFSFRQQNYFFADFANCFKLDQNIFEDIVEDALLNIKQVAAGLHYPGSEIPKWFNFQSMGYFINVELPPDWFHNNFLGFAICVAVVSDHQVDFESKSMCEINLTSKDGRESVWGKYWCSTFVNSNHVSVKSFILPFDLQKLLCYENEVTFEFCLHSSSLKIEKCGVHLMFGEKVDGSSWVGKDEDVLSLANVHDNCEEVNEPQKIDGDTQLIKVNYMLPYFYITNLSCTTRFALFNNLTFFNYMPKLWTIFFILFYNITGLKRFDKMILAWW